MRVERNRLYLLGREFTIYNDHKPLIQLLNNPNSTIPPRIERMTLRLQCYTFIMKHVSSEDNISDYTSRHPITNNSDNTETNFIDYICIIHHRITPLWPQANGLVERFNRPLMKAIRAATIQGKDIELETYRFLQSYPLYTTSSYE